MTHSYPKMPPAIECHVSKMIALGLKKHQDAIALIGQASAGARVDMRQILSLLAETELLLEDVSTYLNSRALQRALKELHTQQSLMRLALNSMELTNEVRDQRGFHYLLMLLALSIPLLIALG